MRGPSRLPLTALHARVSALKERSHNLIFVNSSLWCVYSAGNS